MQENRMQFSEIITNLPKPVSSSSLTNTVKTQKEQINKILCNLFQTLWVNHESVIQGKQLHNLHVFKQTTCLDLLCIQRPKMWRTPNIIQWYQTAGNCTQATQIKAEFHSPCSTAPEWPPPLILVNYLLQNFSNTYWCYFACGINVPVSPACIHLLYSLSFLLKHYQVLYQLQIF